jgi:glycosyltransferase involved in cell wall biosynthesis
VPEPAADSLANLPAAPHAPPEVSCIIIFYNGGGAFLREAVESVLAQTHANWELLLCDDGSTDDSTAVARQYAARHPDRIRCVEHDGHANRGMSATRNLGLRHAAGEFISFLDADDVWAPRKLEEQVGLLRRHPEAGIVFGPLLLWRGWTGRPEDKARDEVQCVAVPHETLVPPGGLVPLYLRDERLIPSGLMFRREVLDAVGRYNEEFRGLYEDLVVTTKICLRWPAYASGRCWYHYRQHPRSSCTTAARAGTESAARARFLTWLDGHLRETRPRDDALRAVVAGELASLRERERRGILDLPGRARERVRQALKAAGRRAFGPAGRRWLRDRVNGEPFAPPPGWVRLGALRRVTPVSRGFGWHRGEPIDRYYIDSFLRSHAADIRGRVLEIGDASYTRKFGGGRVTRSDVLHATEGNPHATIVGDLQTGRGLPGGAFNCILLTQALPSLFDVRAAVGQARRALAPGGVVLATMPGISQIRRHGTDHEGDFWRFTSKGTLRLFADAFGGEEHVRVETFGNVLAAVGLLHGLDRGELKDRELAHHDPEYEVIVGVRAERASAPSGFERL